MRRLRPAPDLVVAQQNPAAGSMSIPLGWWPEDDPPERSLRQTIRGWYRQVVARLARLVGRRPPIAAPATAAGPIAAPAVLPASGLGPAVVFTATTTGRVASAQDARWRWLVNSPRYGERGRGNDRRA